MDPCQAVGVGNSQHGDDDIIGGHPGREQAITNLHREVQRGGRWCGRCACRGASHQERTRVRMARSATDSSAKSHVPVASIAANVVRTCASPCEFCASQRSASSLGLP